MIKLYKKRKLTRNKIFAKNAQQKRFFSFDLSHLQSPLHCHE